MGEKPLDIEKLWDIMWRATLSYGRKGAVLHGISGVDLALWDLAGRRGLAAVNAAPYGGGILSKGPTASPTYAYRPASADLLARAQRLEELCAQFQVPLAAAALQFSMRDPRIASTVVGISRSGRLAHTIALAQHPIPNDFWSTAQAIRPDTVDLG